jgi:hypothetical protein
MSPVRTCAYTGIFARMGLVFQSLLSRAMILKDQVIMFLMPAVLTYCIESMPSWPGQCQSEI